MDTAENPSKNKSRNSPPTPSEIGLGPVAAEPEALPLSLTSDASAEGSVQLFFGDEPSARAFKRISGLAKLDGDLIVTITPTSTAISVVDSDFVATAEELRSNPNAPAEGVSMILPTSYVRMLCGAHLAPKIPFGFRLKVDLATRRVVATQGRKTFAFAYRSPPVDQSSKIPALGTSRQVDTDALHRAVVAVNVARPRRSKAPFDRILVENGLVWAGNPEKISIHEDSRLAGLTFGLPLKLYTAFREALRHMPASGTYGIAGDWSVMGGAGTYFAWPTTPGSIAPHLLEPLRSPSALTIAVNTKDFLDTLWAFSALDNSPDPNARLALRENEHQLTLQAYVQEIERHPAQSLLVTTIEHDAEIVVGRLDADFDLSASVDYVALRDFAGPDYDQTKHLNLEWITRKDHALLRLRRVSANSTTVLALAGNRTSATTGINTKRRRK